MIIACNLTDTKTNHVIADTSYSGKSIRAHN